MSTKMPVLFVGHGSPMNAVLDNAWSRGFAALGPDLPTPKAILAISAHWFTPGTFLTGVLSLLSADGRRPTMSGAQGSAPASSSQSGGQPRVVVSGIWRWSQRSTLQKAS